MATLKCKIFELRKKWIRITVYNNCECLMTPRSNNIFFLKSVACFSFSTKWTFIYIYFFYKNSPGTTTKSLSRRFNDIMLYFGLVFCLIFMLLYMVQMTQKTPNDYKRRHHNAWKAWIRPLTIKEKLCALYSTPNLTEDKNN